jgi:hypothetical protein
MHATWEKAVHHVGTLCGHDVGNELQNEKTVVITKPEHTQQHALDKHANRVTTHDDQEQCLTRARLAQQTAHREAITAGNAEAPQEMLRHQRLCQLWKTRSKKPHAKLAWIHPSCWRKGKRLSAAMPGGPVANRTHN